MDLNITNSSGKSSGSVTLADAVFGAEFKEPLIHQAVHAYLAGARAGTHAQKTRSEVRGGGAKPWRQKGTGRARAGTIRSPIWRGGGKAFAAKTRDYSQKLNRKMYQGAIRSILSELARQERLIIIDELKMDKPSTKALAATIKGLNVSDVLLVTEGFDENVFLSARNLIGVDICEAAAIDPVCLVRPAHVIMTVAAAKQIEEKFS